MIQFTVAGALAAALSLPGTFGFAQEPSPLTDSYWHDQQPTQHPLNAPRKSFSRNLYGIMLPPGTLPEETSDATARLHSGPREHGGIGAGGAGAATDNAGDRLLTDRDAEPN
jgi:hypothetical protein